MERAQRRKEHGNESSNRGTTLKDFAVIVCVAMKRHYADRQVSLNEVTKNNGCSKTGITITEKESSISPNIYLNHFYEQYQAGTSLASIFNEITQIYEATKHTGQFSALDITDFDLAKTKICYKLVNAKRNKSLLEQVPYRRYHDLAVLYYLLIAEEEEGTATVVIRNEYIKMWGITEKTLYELASENTPRLLKCCVSSMTEVLDDILGTTNQKADDEFPFEDAPETEMPIYVATNVKKLNGAVTILYDGILQEFSKRAGGDFYILPSSIHEMLFVKPLQYMGANELIEMVRDVNTEQVAPEEVLSDNVYYYSSDTGYVKMME